MVSQGIEGQAANDAIETALGIDLDGNGLIDGKDASLVEKKNNFELDLEKHIVSKCSQALLLFMREEESKIRHKPSESSRDIVKDVFLKYSVQCSAAPVVLTT